MSMEVEKRAALLWRRPSSQWKGRSWKSKGSKLEKWEKSKVSEGNGIQHAGRAVQALLASPKYHRSR